MIIASFADTARPNSSRTRPDSRSIMPRSPGSCGCRAWSRSRPPRRAGGSSLGLRLRQRGAREVAGVAAVLDTSTAHRVAPGWTCGFPELLPGRVGRSRLPIGSRTLAATPPALSHSSGPAPARVRVVDAGGERIRRNGFPPTRRDCDEDGGDGLWVMQDVLVHGYRSL
jgi:hypothetical protein